jgi:hypothetical protein
VAARATTIETGLFEIQADDLSNFKKTRQVCSDSQQIVYAMFAPPSPIDEENESTPPLVTSDPLITGDPEKPPRRATPSASHMVGSNFDFARCFLRLANLPNFALDRLSRYEATLWRQAARKLCLRSITSMGANEAADSSVREFSDPPPRSAMAQFGCLGEPRAD